MRICNNKDGMPDCSGGCYDGGICHSKCKCEDSLVLNEDLVKMLMLESGRHQKMLDKFHELAKVFRQLDNE